MSELQEISDRIYSDLNRLAELALGPKDQQLLTFPRFSMILVRPVFIEGSIQVKWIEKDGVDPDKIEEEAKDKGENDEH